MIHQFREKMMEQYDLTTWQKSSRQSLMVLRNGQLKLGWLSWQKEEDKEKSSILLEP